MLPPDFDGRRGMEKMGDNRHGCGVLTEAENRKGPHDWRMASRLGFFRGFSNREGETTGPRD
jgi:hypothetical protein